MAIVPVLPFAQVAGENSNVNVSITPGASAKTTDAYSPSPVSIDVGDSVIWTNNDPPSVHTAVSGTPSEGPDGKFGGTPESPFSEIIVPGATSSHTFTESGEYPYYCVLHPSMVGRVIVGQSEESITVRTDKSVYEIGDDVKITGQVEPPNPDLQVLLRITNEDGELVRLDVASVEEGGRYRYEFNTGGALFEANKSYSVSVAYRSAVAETEFSITRPERGCEGLAPTISGTDRDDVLVGTDGNDVIDGLRGNDVIQGKDGNDIICGGPGFDEIHGGNGDDRVYGGRGNDELHGDLGNDRLWGGTGWDKLFGGAGDDAIFGGKGNDMLQGEEDDDRLDGQDGQDVLDGVPDDDIPTSSRNIILDPLDDEYDAGDSVEISGMIDNVDSKEDEVTIRIDGPDSETETVTLDDDEFSWEYDIPDPADDGIYSVEVEYDNESVFTYFFIDDDNDLNVVTDKDTYEFGDNVEIAGEVNDPQLDVEEVEITVYGPDGDTVAGMDEEAVELDGDAFEIDFDLDDDEDAHGIYAVLVTYNNDDDEEGYVIFEVESDGGSSITASLSKTGYRQGEEVRITGEVEEVEGNDDVVLVVLDPDGDEIHDDAAEPETDGSFGFEFTLDDYAKTGSYEVTLSYIQADNDQVLLFSVTTSGGGNEDPLDIQVDLDRTAYDPGDDVDITGVIKDGREGEMVAITVHEADGGSDRVDTEIVSGDGEFSAVYILSDIADDGIYQIEIEFGREDSVFTFFIVDEEEDEINVITDQDSYVPGEDVTIAGEVEDQVVGVNDVEITIVDPSGEHVLSREAVEMDESGTFEYDAFELDVGALHGRYAVIVEYDGEEKGFFIFEVESRNRESILVQPVDDEFYRPGEEVIIEGATNKFETGRRVFLKVLDPDGIGLFNTSAVPESSGSFEFRFVLDSNAKRGDYSVFVWYAGQKGDTIFTVTDIG